MGRYSATRASADRNFGERCCPTRKLVETPLRDEPGLNQCGAEPQSPCARRDERRRIVQGYPTGGQQWDIAQRAAKVLQIAGSQRPGRKKLDYTRAGPPRRQY